MTHTVGNRFRWWGKILSVASVLVLAAGIAATLVSHGPNPELQLQPDRADIAAGGDVAHIVIRSTIPLAASGLEVSLAESTHSARVARSYSEAGTWHVTIQSKALPGKVKVTASLPPFAPASTWLTVLANEHDSARDGTPDVLRLDDPADAAAFRAWFSFLAEAQFFRETSTLPREIADCAGLIRYSYREALRPHGDAWAKSSGLPLVPAIAQVRKYEYPFTPWGAALFRTAAGALVEFADAGTLLRYNTHFVARDIRQAQQGDLIFFHQPDAAMPYHSMIYIGRSQIENAGGPYVVYHTGPQGETGGEIRRPSLEELQRHPDPAWHLSAENPHYLGVYRWNILWR